VHVKARKVQQAMETLEQRHGRLATDAEMAEALGLSLDEYHGWLDDIRPAAFVYLDEAHREVDESESTHHDLISDPTEGDAAEAASRAEVAALIAERIQQLPALHKKVIALYYFEGLRLREIAQASGLCESRICQIHTQAILAIRTYLQSREALPPPPQAVAV
jgi:RNA polymerase sigma factor for flagellar operon FliA